MAQPNPFTLIGSITRLWCLRRPRSTPLESTDPAILIFALLALIAFVAIDRFSQGPAAQFDSAGFPIIGLYVLAGLSGAWVLTRVVRPHAAFAEVLLLIAAAAPVLIGVRALIERYAVGYQAGAAWAAWFAYFTAYLRRGFDAVTGTRPRLMPLAAAAMLTALGWLAVGINWDAGLWYPPSEEKSAAYARIQDEAEDILFEQSQKIDSALGAVAMAGGIEHQVYFLGFAGVGEQQVFADEIALAERRVDERYGIASRHLELINDMRDTDTHPIASASGLRRALLGIGAKMDRDRDVLFLAISSHGSEDPALSVSNGPLPLRELDGEELASALHDAGIRWKVIVISACYAGGFIDYLKDDHTIVIAAAAADRTSFGCSNDRDLTYFGEAFYRDALPKAPSLRSAFTAAQRAIARREREEKIEESYPTAFFGAAMEAKLAVIDAQRAPLTARAPSAHP